jgi:4-hydroxy 2-oxovalerate aldolase
MSPDLVELLVELKVDTQALHPGTRLEEVGLDSLAFVELSMILAERGVEIGEDELAAAATLGALDRIVVPRLPAR